jgi:hypothetical protein
VGIVRRAVAATALTASAVTAAVLGQAGTAQANQLGPGELLGQAAQPGLTAVPADLLYVQGVTSHQPPKVAQSGPLSGLSGVTQHLGDLTAPPKMHGAPVR